MYHQHQHQHQQGLGGHQATQQGGAAAAWPGSGPGPGSGSGSGSGCADAVVRATCKLLSLNGNPAAQVRGCDVGSGELDRFGVGSIE